MMIDHASWMVNLLVCFKYYKCLINVSYAVLIIDINSNIKYIIYNILNSSSVNECALFSYTVSLLIHDYWLLFGWLMMVNHMHVD